MSRLSYLVDLGIREARGVAVALGYNRVGGQWPFDPDLRIIPTHGSGQIRIVVAGQLVDDVGLVAHHIEAMRKPRRDPHQPAICLAQLIPGPLPEGLTGSSQVDGDIEDG